MSATLEVTTAPFPTIGLAYPRTPTEFRNTLGHRLILGTVDGVRWASNNYYLSPAERFADVIGGLDDGCYNLDGREWTFDRPDVPNLRHFLNVDDYVNPVELTTVAGNRATFVAIGPLASKQAEETLAVPFSETASLNARYLRLLTHLDPLNRSYGDRLSNVHLRQRNGELKPVGIFVDVERRRGGCNGPDGRWIPETFEPAGERLIGVIMPARLS